MNIIDEHFYNIAKNYMTDEDITQLYSIVKDVIEHEEYIKRKDYLHHENSVFDHSICVCLRSIKIANKLPFKFNYEAIAIGSLLHDFYYVPWQNNPVKRKFFEQHGYSHPYEALSNANEHFEHIMNPITKDIIRKHMWPLTIRYIPVYRESWIVNIADKIESLNVFKDTKKYILIFMNKKNKE